MMRAGLVALCFGFTPACAIAADAMPLWIDTDAACDQTATNDVDDCLALFHLAQWGVDVAGVSSVFGNAPRGIVDATLAEIVPTMWTVPPEIFAGAETAGACDDNAAVRAMAKSLQRSQHTILALGPLTNIDCLLRQEPDTRANIAKIIVVMGARAGHLFHPAEDARDNALLQHGLKFSDMNFEKDKDAAALVLASSVPIVLVPYEAARWIELTGEGLAQMKASGGTATQLATRSQGWIDFWRRYNGRDGFYPFDLVAAMVLTTPSMFDCARVKTYVESDQAIGVMGGGPRRLLIGPLPWSARTPGHEANLCLPKKRDHVRALDVRTTFDLSPREDNP